MPALDFMNRILTSVGLSHEPDPPLLSTQSAALLSTRPSRTLSRDAPSVIKARVRVVTIACITSTLITAFIASKLGSYALFATLHVLGYWPVSLFDIGRSLILLCILFAGPIFEAVIVERRWRHWTLSSFNTADHSNWIVWRNYVAGPVTEEVLFRSVLISVHLFARVSPSKLVFLTPLYFGIAHAHHFYEFRVQHPEYPISVGVLRTLLQLAYTSLFGFYAAFLFLRTGSIYAAIVAHAFCNYMGLPRFWGRVERDVDDIATSAAESRTADVKLHLLWTIAYYSLLLVGSLGFYVNLWTLTESKHGLVRF